MKYNGWLVLTIVTLFEGFSGVGRSAFLSPFLKDMGRDLSLSTGNISNAFGISHLLTALSLPLIGHLYDRIKPVYFLGIFVLLFSGAFLLMSQLGALHHAAWVHLCLLGVCYTGIRISLHAYSIVGRSTIAIWFSKQRWLAMNFYSLVTMLIGTSIPWMACVLHKHYPWQNIWIAIGMAWIVMLLLCGFAKKPVQKTYTAEPMQRPQRNTVLFPFILLTLFFKAFQNTGIRLHWAPLCEYFHADPQRVAFCFQPIGILALMFTSLFGYFFSKMNPKMTLWLFLVSDLGLLCALNGMHIPYCMYAFIAFSGLYIGLNNVVATLVIPFMFGVRNIGALHGWAYAFISLGSAFGSAYFGWMKDHASYALGLKGCMAFSAFLLLLFFALQSRMNTAFKQKRL